MKKVGYFNRPSDQQLIVIIAKRNESDDAAIERVAKKHGVDPSKVSRGTPPDNPGHTAVMEDVDGPVTPEAFEASQAIITEPALDVIDVVKAASTGDVGLLSAALRAALSKYEGSLVPVDPDDAMFSQHNQTAETARKLFSESL